MLESCLRAEGSVLNLHGDVIAGRGVQRLVEMSDSLPIDQGLQLLSGFG